MPRNNNTSGLRRGGSPGRPKGVPNKATKEFKAFAEKFFKSREYRENVKTRILEGKAGPFEVYIAQLLFGKPRETVELIDDRPLAAPIQIVRMIEKDGK